MGIFCQLEHAKKICQIIGGWNYCLCTDCVILDSNLIGTLMLSFSFVEHLQENDVMKWDFCGRHTSKESYFF